MKVTAQTSSDELLRIVEQFHKAPSDMIIPDHDEIRSIFSADSVERIFQRLSEAKTKFSERTLKTLSKMSPLALCVTFEQLKRGKNLSLLECFKMEFSLAVNMIGHHTEMFEGIRALLIDKDRKPKWTYKTVREVPAQIVEQMFVSCEQVDWHEYQIELL